MVTGYSTPYKYSAAKAPCQAEKLFEVSNEQHGTTFLFPLRIRNLNVGLRTRSNAPFVMKKGIILLIYALMLFPVFSQKITAKVEPTLQAKLSSYDVHLSWKGTVFPDGHDEVERSEDGRTFLLLDCIPSSEVDDPEARQFTDANARFLIGPVLYYRVKSVYADGTTLTGPIVRISIDPHYLSATGH